jgi:hypothetical protein
MPSGLAAARPLAPSPNANLQFVGGEESDHVLPLSEFANTTGNDTAGKNKARRPAAIAARRPTWKLEEAD